MHGLLHDFFSFSKWMIDFNPGYEGPGASSADRRPDPASAGVRRDFVLLSCLPMISLFPAGVRGHARACVNACRRPWLAQLIVYVARVPRTRSQDQISRRA